ncbi:MAG: SAM-dependent methyltransferase, partial [Bacteroidota bacterium]
DGSDDVRGTEVNWDHPVSAVINALINAGLTLRSFHEFDYSPYKCFNDMVSAGTPGHWHLRQMPGQIPMVYSLDCRK